MASAPDYATCRTTPFTARSLLKTLGYTVARVSGLEFPVDLIAWKNKTDILLIRIRSFRSTFSLEHLSGDIRSLSGMAASGTCPGEIQLWVRVKAQWKRYRVMPGGIISVPGGRYDC